MEMFNEEPTCDLLSAYSVKLTGEYCTASLTRMFVVYDDDGHCGGD